VSTDKHAIRTVAGRILLVGFLLNLLLAAPACALDPNRSLAQMFHRTFTRDDGLAGAVTALAQTPDGYLWIGTDSGVFRFDGVRFEHITDRRIPSLDIRNLAVTPDGDLWIAYGHGGVSRMRGSSITYFAPGAGGPSGEANAFRTARQGGGLWLVADLLPWRFNGHRWIEMTGDWRGPNTQGGGLWSLAAGRDGTVWGKDGEHLYYCRPGCARFAMAPANYAGGVMSIASGGPDGRAWTSDSHAPGRIYALPDIARLADTKIPGPSYGAQISDRIHGSIFLDREGELWNVTGQHGLLRVRSIVDAAAASQAESYTKQDGLTSNLIFRFYEDREGNFWVGTRRGLDEFRAANIVAERQIPVADSYYGSAVTRTPTALYVFAALNDGSLVTSDNTGTLFRVGADGVVHSVIEKITGFQTMTPMSNGDLMIATGEGLSRLVGDKLSTEQLPSEMPKGAAINTIAEDASGGLWLGVAGDGVWRRRQGGWSHIPVRPDLPKGTPMTLIADRQNAIWVTYRDDGKLVRFANGHAQLFATDAGPRIGRVVVIQPDREGVLLGGEFGLSHYDHGRFHNLRTDRAPALSFVAGIAESTGQTWIQAHSAILRFNNVDLEHALNDPNARARYELFDRLDGMPGETDHNNSLDSAVPGPDGKIWFLTTDGVVWIDPHNVHRNTLQPPVAIRSLIVNNHAYGSPGNLDLAAGTSRVEIDYAALSFSEPSRVRFRYKLDGVDNDWIDAGQRRQAFYTQLGAGAYTFHVIAANDAGVWNRTGAATTFTIAPTFVESIWFKLLFAISLAGLAWLAYALRVRQVKAQLQTGFDVRIAERERIARELHDTLLQGCQGLLLKFQSIANRFAPGDEIRRTMEDALSQADAVLAEGRSRVRELRNSRTAGDLAQSLVDAASSIIGCNSPSFRLTVEGEPRALNALVGEEIQRIFEEAIRNVVKHAHADTITAHLTYGHQSLRLSVQDNGMGIAQSKLIGGSHDEHFGLVGMRERAERIGGKLEVNSREGHGAEVLMLAPARVAYNASRLWSPGRSASKKEEALA
jgi:signal transduction histidine kinase/ligand-binding sensor domain-containing protein